MAVNHDRKKGRIIMKKEWKKMKKKEKWMNKWMRMRHKTNERMTEKNESIKERKKH